MRPLIIGQQAREFSLAWRLSQHKEVKHVYLARNSASEFQYDKISLVTEFAEPRPENFQDIVSFCGSNAIDYVVVGSMGPMEAGLVDYLLDAGIPTIGAGEKAVELEASKMFSKSFMERHGVPTPKYQICNDLDDVKALDSGLFPCYLKSDRVIRSHYSAMPVTNIGDAINACSFIFDTQDNYYGQSKLLAEEICNGVEVSFTILFDGENWCALPSCKDYKKLGEGDTGQNTSGMGCISPSPDLTERGYREIVKTIVQPTVDGLKAEGLNYSGFLYFGIVLAPDGAPTLLEYNCRLGDPEAQTMMMLMSDEFSNLLYRTASGSIGDAIKCSADGYACSVYIVPAGYPEFSEQGIIHSIPSGSSSNCLWQGFPGAIENSHQRGVWLTGGNRVICVSAFGKTRSDARRTVYEKVKKIKGKYLYYRRDIGL